jgi:hypothetical protein
VDYIPADSLGGSALHNDNKIVKDSIIRCAQSPIIYEGSLFPEIIKCLKTKKTTLQCNDVGKSSSFSTKYAT